MLPSDPQHHHDAIFVHISDSFYCLSIIHSVQVTKIAVLELNSRKSKESDLYSNCRGYLLRHFTLVTVTICHVFETKINEPMQEIASVLAS